MEGKKSGFQAFVLIRTCQCFRTKTYITDSSLWNKTTITGSSFSFNTKEVTIEYSNSKSVKEKILNWDIGIDFGLDLLGLARVFL